jgi:hypothetical protein
MKVGGAGADHGRVHPLGAARFSQGTREASGRAPDCLALLIGQIAQPSDMAPTHDKEMPEVRTRRRMKGRDGFVLPEEPAWDRDVAAKLPADQTVGLGPHYWRARSRASTRSRSAPVPTQETSTSSSRSTNST